MSAPLSLDFTIERRAGIDVVVFANDSCRPAMETEVAMWNRLGELALAPTPFNLHRLVLPEWLSEQIGDQFNDVEPGQAWRMGFNECRYRTQLLVDQALGVPARLFGARAMTESDRSDGEKQAAVLRDLLADDYPSSNDEAPRFTLERAALQAAISALQDTALLDAVQRNRWKVAPTDLPTGMGDADVGWRVIEEDMSSPSGRRIVHEHPTDNVREALATAMQAATNDPGASQ